MVMQNVVICGSALLPTLMVTYIILIELSMHQDVTSNTTNHLDQFNIQMISSKFVRITDLQAHMGYISSENYPGTFPVNSTSLISLEINHNPTLDTVRLTFMDLNLHISNHCESEALAILLGNGFNEETDMRTRKIFVVCGSTIPQPVIVSTRNLLLHFESDEFNRGDKRGFRIKYEFLDSGRQLYGGCDRQFMFKCRNRRCIPDYLMCNHIDDCGDASDEDRMTPCDDLPTIKYGINYLCGWSRKTNDTFNSASRLLQNRIVGGKRVSEESSLPFQVSIQTMRIETLSHICGGTLIHPMFVLSAAHCFSGLIPSTDYKFLFGVNDLTQAYGERMSSKIQVRYAASIKLFPGGSYYSDFGVRHIDMTHDLALVELNAPIKMTNHVWPACLPHLDEQLVANLECLVSGYGETRGTGDLFILKKVKQIIQHISNCIPEHDEFEVDDHSMICAKSLIDNGPCNGDSGGPLFCSYAANNSILNDDYKEETSLRPGELIKYLPLGESGSTQSSSSSSKVESRPRYTVHGITSYTTDGNFGGGFCGLDRVPTVYARISPKVDWILAQMKMAMPRLSRDDNRQNPNNRSGLFGYMFRTGVSRHKNYTREMTIYSTSTD